VRDKNKRNQALESPLWPQLEEIHGWRRFGMTWKAISEKVSVYYGTKLTLQAVRLFFVMANRSKVLINQRSSNHPSPQNQKPGSLAAIEAADSGIKIK
jgi:hypothetical protein